MSNILLVEDNENTSKIVTSILAGIGHLVVSVPEPRDGLDRLKSEFFDLIIADVMMPGGVTGFDFVKTVKQMPEYATLPVAFLTGRRERKDIEKGLAAGADDYIVKPVDPDVLIAKVTGLLKAKPRKSDFAKCAINRSAVWDSPITVVEVSEIGLKVCSALPVPIGTKLRIQCEIFNEIGIDAPMLRVIGCKRSETGEGLFDVSLHFLGLSEKEMRPLRLFVRSMSISPLAS